MNIFAVVIILIVSVAYSEQYPQEELNSTTLYRADSRSCQRFHAAVSRKENECIQTHVLYGKVHCNFSCIGTQLSLQSCHVHENNDQEYPFCADLYCRDARQVTNCSELPVEDHFKDKNLTEYPIYT